MKAGQPGALLELRVRNEDGLVPWDGSTMGDLEVRGAYVASAYYRADDDDGRFTEDGWFRTGDVATIDAMGYLEIRDRSKDLIKSGGEWISSVALEGALMSHPAVAEAAVVAVPHPRWLERPVAAVVLRAGMAATAEELRAYLAGRFPTWWLPDDMVFVPAIPRTSTGKFLKSALRDALRTNPGGP
jgi:fatty-acyl-CoA synthase